METSRNTNTLAEDSPCATITAGRICLGVFAARLYTKLTRLLADEKLEPAQHKQLHIWICDYIKLSGSMLHEMGAELKLVAEYKPSNIPLYMQLISAHHEQLAYVSLSFAKKIDQLQSNPLFSAADEQLSHLWLGDYNKLVVAMQRVRSKERQILAQLRAASAAAKREAVVKVEKPGQAQAGYTLQTPGAAPAGQQLHVNKAARADVGVGGGG